MKRPVFLSVIISLVFLTCPALGVIYVSPTGNDVTGDGSAGNPYLTIQKGINTAVGGDTVQAAAGTYSERIDFKGKAITVRSADPDNASVVAATVIDGGLGGSVVKFATSETSSSVITGFTITNGRAANGGGIYCDGTSPTISKNMITENSTTEGGNYRGGGGIYCKSAAPSITNCTISDNDSNSMGGGIGCYSGSSPTISNCVLQGNQAQVGGGGICFLASEATVTGCTIVDNDTTGWEGGGILAQWASDITVSNCTLTDNSANGGGGMSFIEGGPSGEVENCVIKGNWTHAAAGGWGGGGIHCKQMGTVKVTNCVVAGNMVAREGGGGILGEGSGYTEVMNCTVSENVTTVNVGGGIAAEWGSNVTVKDSIVHSNTGPSGNNFALWGNNAKITISYSDAGGGAAAVYNDGGTLTWGLGNVDVDPLFASGGDYHLQSKSGRWDPAAGGGAGGWVNDAVSSPCIDAGNPASAYSNEPAPNGGRINQGAYGNTAHASKSAVKLTMAVNNAAFGTTTPAAGVHDVSVEETVAISATAQPGAAFVNWTASPPGNASIASATSPSTDATIYDNVTITANFTNTVPTPTFSPAPGLYQTAQVVTVACTLSGVDIRYTTNGSTPTAASPLYTAPLNVNITTTIKAMGIRTGLTDSDVATGLYRIDSQGPAISNIATVPTAVREKVDNYLTLTATADDSAKGGSNIAQAECFIGPDLGAGNGSDMSASDGTFSAPTEAVTVQLNCASWVKGFYRIYVRAQDVAGNWGSVDSILVEVVDGTPPGLVTNLSAIGRGSLQKVTAAVDSYSSAAAGYPASALVDTDAASAWQTMGTVTAETEYVVLDVLSVKKLGAIALVPGKGKTLFPAEFIVELSLNGTTWSEVLSVRAFKAAKASYLWQFPATDARYVKISGPGMYDPKDKHYRWQIAGATLYRGGGCLVELSWTAPADDGYLGAAASQYDFRYSDSMITAAGFGARPQLTGIGAPKAPGSAEVAVAVVPIIGTTFVAMKTGDEVPNWSLMSNVASTSTYVSAFEPVLPNDGASLGAGFMQTFIFTVASDIKPVSIAFSNCPEIVTTPSAKTGGEVRKSVKFPVKPGTSAWTPSSGQWKSIKKTVGVDGVLYWRLEGVSPAYGTVFGPVRALLFDTGSIGSMWVSPSPAKGSDEAVWPDASAAPGFYWVDNTNGMKYFLVDVSTDESIPLSDKKKTITLGGSGFTGTSYGMSKSDWKKVRQLAVLGDGVLWWRVRALDADKCLTSASGVKKLVVDGGTFTLGDLDLSAASPSVSWTHAGEGLVKYKLQFSIADSFQASTKFTIYVPSSAIAATTYTLTAADVKKLDKLAKTNHVTTLYYRVCGEDAEKAFKGYSSSKMVNMP